VSFNINYELVWLSTHPCAIISQRLWCAPKRTPSKRLTLWCHRAHHHHCTALCCDKPPPLPPPRVTAVPETCNHQWLGTHLSLPQLFKQCCCLGPQLVHSRCMAGIILIAQSLLQHLHTFTHQVITVESKPPSWCLAAAAANALHPADGPACMRSIQGPLQTCCSCPRAQTNSVLNNNLY
jgi:hypothetical protein